MYPDNHDYNYISLFDAVEQYMISINADRRKYFMNYMVHGRIVFLDLVKRNVVSSYKSRLVAVDKSQYPFRVTLPADCLMFLGAGVVNSDYEHRDLVYKNDMAVPLNKLYNSGKSTCGCGKHDEVREQVDQITVVLSDIVIDGKIYSKEEHTKILKDGTVVKIIRTPVKAFTHEGQTSSLEYVTTQEVVCKLDTEDCGCVVKNDANISKVFKYCGCSIGFRNAPHRSTGEPFTGYGYVRKEGRYLYIQGNVPENIIVTYKSNAMCPNTEIMVPVEALDALMMGINWRMKAFSPNSGRLDVRESRRTFITAIEELMYFQCPIIVSELLDLEMRTMKWGAPASIDVSKHLPVSTEENPVATLDENVLKPKEGDPQDYSNDWAGIDW